MNRAELKDALIASLIKQIELLEKMSELKSDDGEDSEDELSEALTESKKMSAKNWAPSPS